MVPPFNKNCNSKLKGTMQTLQTVLLSAAIRKKTRLKKKKT
jgi:hypothetical protein